MHKDFEKFIESGRKLADRNGVHWDISPAPDGSISAASVWELNGLCGTSPPPRILLSDLGTDSASLAPLNRRLLMKGLPPIQKVALSKSWQDLIKAAVLDQIFIRGNKARHALLGIARPLKVIGTCALGVNPWDLTPEQVALAREVALEVQPSGQLAAVIEGVTRHVIDYNHLTVHSPLLPRSSKRSNEANIGRSARPDPRRELADRKSPEKLPGESAFWELVRIAFSERPKTFMDELRFAQVRLLILCGLRIGEVCLIPLEWQRAIDYVDGDGMPAGASGGISRSLILRYFSEKRSLDDNEGTLLYQEAQHIPPIFEQALKEALDRVAKLTAPLRSRLRQQVESGRVLPEFAPDDLLPVVELYPYLSGNPFICQDSRANELIAKYREAFDPSVLLEIQNRQKILLDAGVEIRNEVRIYFSRIRRGRESKLPFRTSAGHLLTKSDYKNGFFRISDLEAFLPYAMPTKMPDMEGFRSTNGPLEAYDFLFLNPKRSLIEERDDGICDVTRYIGIGRVTSEDVMKALGYEKSASHSLFHRYGETPSARQLTVDSHAFRHLQNTELYRLGVADAIITKHFGRKSVDQSYVYDHRSLAEDLDAMDPPAGGGEVLGPKAIQAFKLISNGKVAGPLVEQFRKIQKRNGDEAAFAFLAAEADGFHSTPYGFCINSFTVDPCPKHLECFNGCRHLAVTNLPAHRENLVRLAGQLQVAVEEISARSSSSIGRENQLKHAYSRLENVRRVLAADPAGHPFPDGPDLSKPIVYSPGSLIDE